MRRPVLYGEAVCRGLKEEVEVLCEGVEVEVEVEVEEEALDCRRDRGRSGLGYDGSGGWSAA